MTIPSIPSLNPRLLLSPARSGRFVESHADLTVAQTVNPVLVQDWDARVKAYGNYSFFHSSAWAKTLMAAYGFTPFYFFSDQAGTQPCLLPVMEVDSWLTGRRGVALPFTDSCRPLCEDAASVGHVIQDVFKFGKSRGWKSIELRGGREFFGEVPASLVFYGHHLLLQEDETQMLARLEGSVRRAIRKAQRNDVTVEVSKEKEAVKVFYSLQCLTRKKHGLPPQPYDFFRNIHEHILSKGLGVIIIARWREHPIAASVYFQLGDQAVYKYGASDEKFQYLRGANLVMWEAIKHHAHQGIKTLHLGRTSLWNGGLRRFKQGWGTREEKIEYFKYDLKRDCFVSENDAACAWYNGIFRRLPVGLSRMIGAMLYRHWA